MATHRRQNVIQLQPPAELTTFDPTEWAGIGDRGYWGPAFCRWLDARRAWADKHGPEGFGGWLAYLRAEHQTRSDMYQAGPPRDG